MVYTYTYISIQRAAGEGARERRLCALEGNEALPTSLIWISAFARARAPQTAGFARCGKEKDAAAGENECIYIDAIYMQNRDIPLCSTPCGIVSICVYRNRFACPWISIYSFSYTRVDIYSTVEKGIFPDKAKLKWSRLLRRDMFCAVQVLGGVLQCDRRCAKYLDGEIHSVILSLIRERLIPFRFIHPVAGDSYNVLRSRISYNELR